MSLALNDPELATHLAAALRKAHIVYAVAIGAAVWIAFVGIRIAAGDTWSPPFEDDAPIRWILRAGFAVVGVVEILTIAYLRRRVVAADQEPTLPVLTVDGPIVVRRLFASAVLGAAFTEAIAVYGLLLTLLGGQWLDVVAFGAAALLLFTAWFPRRVAWEDEARRAVVGASA